MLLVLVLWPIVCALLIAMAPARQARQIAFGGSLVVLALTVVAAFMFPWEDSAAYHALGVESVPFLPSLGVQMSFGVDAVAMWLIILTGFLAPLTIWGSFTAIQERERTYYAWLMALNAAMFGVFVARDIIFFYVAFEFTLVPLFILISLYGSANRKFAAIKFFLYTFLGSIIALAGLVYVAWKASAGIEGWTFQIDALQAAARMMSPREQALVMLALMAGFAVKVPLFPVHTWLPLAHTEAPTAGSVILAGVLLKLGTYAIFRFVLPFVPLAVNQHAGFIAVLSIVGIIYAGLICWVQTDVKKLVAYSSVSHLGFCVLGMFALNSVGAAGSVLYMINHGLSTGALFFCIGFMYERYHTRSMEEVGGLASRMPVWAFFMVFFTLASVGLPGLNGFVSEFMCLMGAFQSNAADLGAGGTGGPLGPWYAAIAGTGMVVAAMYLLIMVGKVVFGDLREPASHHDHHDESHLPADLSRREIGVLVPLALGCLVLGVYPRPILSTIEEPVARVMAQLQIDTPGETDLAADDVDGRAVEQLLVVQAGGVER
ncbi:MAG: NADH-quinone oxidoreductase subunit M [Phycisphaerales bacterium]|nr:NADH-quinone oxidoreductase subunit M [Phycisphaerales bacterium]